ncbi:MAG: hypothetical protein ACJ790_12530 [Myxococcaceae bacterium]
MIDVLLGGLVAGVAFFSCLGVTHAWFIRRVKVIPPPKRAARREPSRKQHRRERLRPAKIRDSRR